MQDDKIRKRASKEKKIEKTDYGGKMSKIPDLQINSPLTLS